MTETKRKIRLGLILQGCVEAALRRTRYSTFAATPKSEDTMEPDFLIPDADAPEFLIEVTQTEGEDSFRMKVLRYFEAVCEGKAHFGPRVKAVNVLMGDPVAELPEANVRAMCSFFDANLNPRGDCDPAERLALDALEAEALRIAGNGDVEDVRSALATVLAGHDDGIGVLARLLEATLDGAEVDEALVPLWETERERIDGLTDLDAPLRPAPPYKRPILQSLFLTDDHFEELLRAQDPNAVSDPAKAQLRAVGLVKERPSVNEPTLVLKPGLRLFLRDADEARRLRGLSEAVLVDEEAMAFFFADIREADRRERMVDVFLRLLDDGRAALEEAVRECLEHGTCAGVDHTRCWLADLMPLYVGESLTSFSRRMYQHPDYTQGLANPYRNVVIRSDYLSSVPEALDEYAALAVDCFYSARRELEGTGYATPSRNALEEVLLQLRLGAAIKLNRLNPLYLVVSAESERLGLPGLQGGSVPSVISDLTPEARSVGRFRVNRIVVEDREVLVNALFVDTYGGLDKAKEWAARGRALQYRLLDGEVVPADRRLIFVADGPWKAEGIRKLRAAGWDVCRLPDFPGRLRLALDLDPA